MGIEFNRIITLLRKERGITQKQAAQDLGISQAQLSHYEKGIRECGLAFVVQVADYYDVSCDYLLGRSAERSGQTINVDDLPGHAFEFDTGNFAWPLCGQRLRQKQAGRRGTVLRLCQADRRGGVCLPLPEFVRQMVPPQLQQRRGDVLQ